MEYNRNNIKIFIEDSYEAMSARGAQVIKSQVDAVPSSVLGFATGSTPVGMYTELIRLNKAGRIDFSKVTTFNLDEYYPIKKSNGQSYDYFMRKNLFNGINIPSGNINLPNGEAIDYKAECEAYERKMAEYGGIDLQLLGIGNNGHVGFNEPGEVFIAPTHHVELDDSTVKANSRFFASADEVPKYALTMGIRAIMTAKKILMLVNGAHKADIICQAVLGPITPKNQASIVQLHSDVTLITDKEAGGLLAERLK